MAVSHGSDPDVGLDAGVSRLRGEAGRRGAAALQGLIALFAVYLFVAAINLMGEGLKTIAEVPETPKRRPSESMSPRPSGTSAWA